MPRQISRSSGIEQERNSSLGSMRNFFCNSTFCNTQYPNSASIDAKKGEDVRFEALASAACYSRVLNLRA